MTEQPPSASKEALELVSRLRKLGTPQHPAGAYSWHHLNLLDAAREIDTLIAQRVSAAPAEHDKAALEVVLAAKAHEDAAVSAETERCAQIALQYRDEVEAGEHAGLGDPERALGQGYAANLIGKRIRAPAERPRS